MLNFFKKNKNDGLPKRFWNDVDLSESELEEFRKDSLFGRGLTDAAFIEILDSVFTPFMKSLGFEGRKNNFCKTHGSLIQTIGIFKNKYGGECEWAKSWYINPGFVKIRLSDFKSEHISFTYPDSMVSFQFYDEPKLATYRKAANGKVFLLNEIEEIIKVHGIPTEEKGRSQEEMKYDRYIEVILSLKK